MGQLVEIEQPALEAVVVGDRAEISDADLADGIDDLGAQFVVQVAAGLGTFVMAQSVEHVLLVQQRVVDEGADMRVAFEAFSEGLRGGLTQLPIGVVE